MPCVVGEIEIKTVAISNLNYLFHHTYGRPDPVAQSVASLTADPGITSSNFRGD